MSEGMTAEERVAALLLPDEDAIEHLRILHHEKYMPQRAALARMRVRLVATIREAEQAAAERAKQKEWAEIGAMLRKHGHHAALDLLWPRRRTTG